MKKIFLILMIVNALMLAQELTQNNLSGSLINDTKIANQSILSTQKVNQVKFSMDRKTPILAALMSFAVPGAGEVYTENYIKAGIFAAVEVTAIVFALSYNKKGDNQTDYFQNYANQNWSAYRYANWTLHHAADINQELTDKINDYKVIDGQGNVNWSELNRLEGDIGSYYSHRLAPYGEQQYYEMIGKYSQFGVGWEEFGDDPTKSYVYGDPLVPQFHWYSKERGKANDYYTVAKWAVIAVVSNHFISAFDAAWSASKYNHRINLNVSVNEEQIGFYKEYYPQLNLKINF
jgi:hypothetical protein